MKTKLKKQHEQEIFNLKREHATKLEELENRIDKLNKEIESHKKHVAKLNKQLEETTKVCINDVLFFKLWI